MSMTSIHTMYLEENCDSNCCDGVQQTRRAQVWADNCKRRNYGLDLRPTVLGLDQSAKRLAGKKSDP